MAPGKHNSMFSFLSPFKRFLQWLGWMNKDATLILLGLDNAGKTTLLHMLKSGHLVTKNPTQHPHFEQLTIGRINFGTYDVGGHDTVRQIWSDYYGNVDAIVFIVDASDTARLPTAREEFQAMIESLGTSTTPVLILGNKIDIAQLSETELEYQLGIQNMRTGVQTARSSLPANTRPLELFMCSITNKEGYGEGFQWLGRQL